MFLFSAENYNELNAFLQKRYIHDGCFKYATFSQTEKTFHVNIVNDIWNDSLCMSFVDIYQFVSITTYEWSNNETINAFIALDSKEKLPEVFGTNIKKGMLYFVWEMFSGNRIYIACAELKIGGQGESSIAGQGDGSIVP